MKPKSAGPALVALLCSSQLVFAEVSSFNIRDFGATGLGAEDATPAFVRAVAACRQAGGGTVYVPAGEYRCLPVTLYDNITLEIAAGAKLLVDLQSPDFRVNSFISADGATNITIKGQGMIDGQAKYVWADYRNDDVEIAKEVALARRAGMEMKRSYRVGKTAYTFLLQNCENVRIEDVSIFNSSSWCMKIRNCNRVTVQGVTINSDLKMGVNSDGIDLDGSRNAHVDGCNISTGDDAICIKSEAEAEQSTNHVYRPIGPGCPAENILVDNCILTSSSTAMMIGTETCGDIRHVLFSNCIIRNANKGLGINVQDGGTVSDIRFANITMDLQRRHWNWWGDAEAFYFVLKKRLPDSKIGAIDNVTIDNVTARAQGTSRIISTVGRPLTNISINNFQLLMEAESTPDRRASDAIQVDGATNLKLRAVTIDWDDQAPEPGWKSGLSLANVDRFQLDDISVRQGNLGSPIPAVMLSNTTHGIIRNNQALPGTGLFFEVAGAGTRQLVFQNNLADEAGSFLKLDPSASPAEIKVKDAVVQ